MIDWAVTHFTVGLLYSLGGWSLDILVVGVLASITSCYCAVKEVVGIICRLM